MKEKFHPHLQENISAGANTWMFVSWVQTLEEQLNIFAHVCSEAKKEIIICFGLNISSYIFNTDKYADFFN